jgi:hypothetical protein
MQTCSNSSIWQHMLGTVHFQVHSSLLCKRTLILSSVLDQLLPLSETTFRILPEIVFSAFPRERR